jgi:hypothetical protein
MEDGGGEDSMYDLVVANSIPQLSARISARISGARDSEDVDAKGGSAALKEVMCLIEDVRALFVRHAGKRDLGEMGSTNFGKVSEFPVCQLI